MHPPGNPILTNGRTTSVLAVLHFLPPHSSPFLHRCTPVPLDLLTQSFPDPGASVSSPVSSVRFDLFPVNLPVLLAGPPLAHTFLPHLTDCEDPGARPSARPPRPIRSRPACSSLYCAPYPLFPISIPPAPSSTLAALPAHHLFSYSLTCGHISSDEQKYELHESTEPILPNAANFAFHN